MNKPLTIIQISTREYGGGAEGSAWNLYNELKIRGHNSYMAVGKKKSNNPDILRIPLSPKKGFLNQAIEYIRSVTESKYHGYRNAERLRYWLPYITDWRKMYYRLRGIEDCYSYGSNRIVELIKKPDVIHCHNLHGSYFDIESLIMLSQTVPVILNVRDAWLLTGHCAHPFNCEKWKTGCGKCPDISVYPKIRFDSTAYNWKRKRNVFKKSNLHVVANSNWMLNQVKESILSMHPSSVIGNGIDLKIFCPGDKTKARIELGLPNDAKIIMFAAAFARSNPFKDYKLMITALKDVAQENQFQEFLFLCLGEESEEQRIGQNIKVKFIGFVKDKEKLAQYYRASDIYLHAAKAESFCKTITEAMACGIPVVATNVGGIPEQISDGENGFLIKPGDSVEMADKVIQLLNCENIRSRFIENALKSSHRFDINKKVDEFLFLYYHLSDKSKTETNKNR